MEEQYDIDEVVSSLKCHVDVRDRKFRLKVYRDCFVASEAVDFLVLSSLVGSREEGVILGRYLQYQNLLQYVVTGESQDDDRAFDDEFLFFRFCDVGLSPEVASLVAKPKMPALLRLFGVQDASDEPTPSTNEPRSPSSIACARKLNQKLVKKSYEINTPFETRIKPHDMRCLALVAHKHMKAPMKAFIEGHSEILTKFRLVGTRSTMAMCKASFGENNPEVQYGPTLTSGALGDDAEMAALLTVERDLGGIIFFMDPLSARQHSTSPTETLMDSMLLRLANLHNVVLCTNPSTAIAMMWMVRQSLMLNSPELLPSFFQSLQSPAVAEYNHYYASCETTTTTTSHLSTNAPKNNQQQHECDLNDVPELQQCSSSSSSGSNAASEIYEL